MPKKWEEYILYVSKGIDLIEWTKYYIQYRSIIQVL